MTLDLENYLPYLLNRAGSRIAIAFTAVVRDYGITLPMWRVLVALQDEGGGVRIGQLSERTSIEISTLSRVIDALEGKGLATRRRTAGDARGVDVQLTAAGRGLAGRILPLARHYEEVALVGFSEAEAAQLKLMLKRLFENMARLEEEQNAGGGQAAG